ncbi:erythromycin esterase family protein [Cupriavidus oxalaticus]|uniref:Erythromycin esterase family protein n=1 Tax=Cupriavidus oxalaticus TaxID=96344 RepID=A0A4P7LHN5_9BURK|nr:erythromycin esterase family protein [Cupriavidus oxalaticus]QBY55744.1 erythromycin esterase family protein [Cupriavidus oxalaticus]
MASPLTPFLAVREAAQRLQGNASDYDPLLDMARGKDFVLLGEATHGTAEFYRMRAQITQALVRGQGFDAVAIEGDWPDAWRVNRYVQGEGNDSAKEALSDFERFPSWMWRNREFLAFIEWLRGHNASLPPERRVGVYGLDLYSLYRSAAAVIRYLERADPLQAEAARQHYAALDHVRDPAAYGYQAAAGLREPARDGAIRQLLQLRTDEAAYISRNGLAAMDSHYFAERNATVVVNAEAYYREMFGRRVSTWNLRDAHMAQTLFSLAAYRLRRGGNGRIVVWAHNSHLGDARATESQLRGEWNLGQLVRQQAVTQALLVGFTTYAGHVCAASRWDGDPEHKTVVPALHDSWEALFHSTGLDRFFLPLGPQASHALFEVMLERAIGVLYLPRTERASHYFDASIAGQFDALFHLDETTALEPLQPGHPVPVLDSDQPD